MKFFWLNWNVSVVSLVAVTRYYNENSHCQLSRLPLTSVNVDAAPDCYHSSLLFPAYNSRVS